VRAYSLQPPHMRSRKEMSQLSALLDMRRALVYTFISLYIIIYL
jgi:hypothetical protein